MNDAQLEDVVRLRSGGPKMTVVGVLIMPRIDTPQAGAVVCTWTKEDGSEGRHEFLYTSLDLVRRKGQPSIYPCGCSMHKVNLGRCDSYNPGQLP